VGRLEEPGHLRLLEGRDRKGGRLVGKLLAVLLAATVLVGGILVYEYLRDKEPPIIEKLDFKIRVEKGQTQDLLVCVREKNPSEYAVLYVNGTSISIPLTERTDGRACYLVSFNPSKYFNREGLVHGELVLTDNSGNTATRQLSFLVNLKAPVIEDVKVERVDLGKYSISATVKDENLERVVLVLDDRQVPLNGEDGKFHGIVETLKDLDFTVIAVDKFNMTST